MCGIAGFLEFAGATREALYETAARMAAALQHRGPDGMGVWVDPQAGIALSHRRLAVVELSELGGQPMQSACGRYIVVFNGEIYNFRSLREELQRRGHRFRGDSDTEVLLAAVAEWGFEPAIRRFLGMFAIALWDRRERTLYVARDRAGEKPLYYGRLGHSFVFGSELSALRSHPDGVGEIDQSALASYLRFGYVPAPHSIFTRIRKLQPGCFLTVGASGVASDPVQYWSAEAVARAGLADPIRCSDQEAIEQLDALLSDAVGLQTYADVPVGAFLSGGIDSATIVALMRRHTRRVKTFTIGFAEDAYNEADHARAVARHLGTEHTELTLSAADAIAVIPKLPDLYGEPFADASQIPTYLVSQLARRQVTVSLSGDGGDEVFGGYNRYSWADTIWMSTRFVPRSLRRVLARALTAVPPQQIDRAVAALRPVLPARIRVRHPGDKLHKGAALLSAVDRSGIYLNLVSHWARPDSVTSRHSSEKGTILTDSCRHLPKFTDEMMLLDSLTYLPDDILVKLDRASMGNSLEARSPFLDHRVIEFAWRLPLELKVRQGKGKWIVRQVLGRYVPPALVDRPKAGFAIPLESWIRGPLRDWAEELLSESSLRADGLFDPAAIRLKWNQHLSGTYNWIGPLWTVLAFQTWYAQMGRTTVPELACELRTN